MKRHISGLQCEGRKSEDVLEGIFLVRVERVFYRWHPRRPFFVLRFVILEPQPFSGRSFTGRLYCTQRALWKLNWFLRDFGYDLDLLGREEVDEKAVVGLRGIVRISRTMLSDHSYLNLEGFAPSNQWEELSVSSLPAEEVHRDL